MSEYEDICMICRRPESKAGQMFKIPNGICVCNDCMHRTMDMMDQYGLGDLMNNPSLIQQMMGSFGFPNFMGNNFSNQATDNNSSTGSASTDSVNNEVKPDEAASGVKAQTSVAAEEKKDEEKPGEEKPGESKPEEKPDAKIPDKTRKNVFPNISFVNLADLQGDMTSRSKIKKRKEGEPRKPIIELKDIPAPHIIKGKLDEYIVGQEHAKKVISVGVYNHYKRVATDTGNPQDTEIEKSNMLMIGPTGCGKTYLVKTLAKILDVPLAIADATSLTEAGYIGDDIESVVSKLLAAAGNDVERAEQGIIFIDEIDKIARKKETTSRDVSGESVQQGMLKLLEGADVEVPVGANSKNAMVPLTTVNTRNILFICGGAFPDIEEIIKRRLSKQAGIGYHAELKDKFDKEKNILSKVTTEDIRKFGMIPEFIGRLPILFTLEGLDEDMLVQVLKEPKNAILKQYQRLLELDEVKLDFEDAALHEIAKKALEKDTGARALRAIIEELMLDIMYEIPKDDNIGSVIITKEYILGTGGPKINIRSDEIVATD